MPDFLSAASPKCKSGASTYSRYSRGAEPLFEHSREAREIPAHGACVFACSVREVRACLDYARSSYALVHPASHPDNCSLLRRLCLKVNASVAAELSVTSSTTELSLLQIDALRAGLPRRHRRPVDVLNRIHEQTHGEDCRR